MTPSQIFDIERFLKVLDMAWGKKYGVRIHLGEHSEMKQDGAKESFCFTYEILTGDGEKHGRGAVLDNVTRENAREVVLGCLPVMSDSIQKMIEHLEKK